MIDIATLYWQFWNAAISGVPAFPEYTVPSTQQFPYITYTISQNAMFDNGIDTVRVWTRSLQFQQLAGFLDQIAIALPHEGVKLYLPDNKGMLALYRGSPFMQREPQEDTALQVGFVNVITRSYIL